MFNHKKKPHILSGALHTLFKAFRCTTCGAIGLSRDFSWDPRLNCVTRPKPFVLNTNPHSLGLSVKEEGFRLSDVIESRIPDIATGEQHRERLDSETVSGAEVLERLRWHCYSNIIVYYSILWYASIFIQYFTIYYC